MAIRTLFIWCLVSLAAIVAVHAAETNPQRLLLLRGVIALGDERTADAVTDLRDAASMYPEDWQCQVLYGQALLNAKQPAMARAMLRRATLLAPTRLEPWKALEQAGRTLKDPHLQLAALAGMARLLPEDPQLQARMASLYREIGQKDAAVKLETAASAALPPLKLDAQYVYRYRPATLEELRKLAKDEPTNAALLPALAAEEWKVAHRDAAREAWKLAYAQTPNDPTVAGNYIHACLETGHIDEAMQALNATAQDNAAFDRLLAVWNLSQGAYTQAIPPLLRLITTYPTDEVLNRQLGTAALFCGNYDLAESALRVSWLKQHTHINAQLYAAALIANKHEADAEKVLTGAIALFPDESMLKVALTLLYRDTHRTLQAADLTAELAKSRSEVVELLTLAGERYCQAGYILRVYEVAYKLRDNYANDIVAMRGAVQLFRRLGASSDARLTVTRYLGPSMHSPLTMSEVMLEAAESAMEDNRLPEAKLALQQALSKDLLFRPAYEALGRLNIQQGQWAEAARVYANALVHWHSDPQFTLAFARASRQAGNYPKAIQAYQDATKLNSSAEPWLELGELYHGQNDETAARVCWQSAANRKGGEVLARLALLASYESAGSTEQALGVINELVPALTAARDARRNHWREIFTVQGLEVSEDELKALLQLEPDLIDTAPLLARQQALQAALHPPTPEPPPTPPATPPAPTAPPPAPPAHDPPTTAPAPPAQEAPPTDATPPVHETPAVPKEPTTPTPAPTL